MTFFHRFTAAFTALAFYLGLAAPYVVYAQDPDDTSEETTEGTTATRQASRAEPDDEALDEEEEHGARSRRASRAESEDESAEPSDEDKPAADTNETEALPSGPGKSAVTPQAISLPKGEGSIEGMGESFTPNLSAGTGTFSVPIALPAGRAGVQPSLALSYSTSGGNGPVGIGWSVAAPFISRQTDRGLPRYLEVSGGRFHKEEDRFMYNGGQELVPVDNDAARLVDSAPVPGDYASWQQYRARVEGAFMRFFRSPRHDKWVVQDKGGTLFEFGLIDEGPSGVLSVQRNSLLSEEPNGEGRVFQWSLTRMSDVHGSAVYYTYSADQGQRYLDSIYYVSPHACAQATGDRRTCSEDLGNYARRVKLVYESRADVFDSYITTWKVSTARRLKRIEVTAIADENAARTLVRRYHLRYDSNSFLSLLSEVQVEGRKADGSPTGEDSLGDGIVGMTLPPMTFAYSQPTSTTSNISGFGGLNGTVHTSPSSPAHSVDEARTDLFDVNSDGLPDVIVTDPARYRTSDGAPAVGVFFNGFAGSNATPGVAGGFSAAVPVPMPAGDSGVMHLGNLNIVPMDIDGDGRSDLLHMPRVASYGYYSPSRVMTPPNLGAGGLSWGEGLPSTDNVSPKSQSWTFAKVAVDDHDGFNDPRIDFGRDGEFMQVLDVNNDHLIDVVRTTGTVMQTWLNLGWVEGGDGRFGQAHLSNNRWVMSPEPIESCVLQGGLPVDFGDPEVRLGDMNGDGLQDIVQMRRGRVQYWPGRGPGLWGEGPAECGRGEGANRYVEMATPPQEVSPELDSVFLSDVNQDGASDVVQVRTQAIDVYFNRAGKSFTARTIINNSPFAPSYAPRIRFADVDGSGTTDILFATANDYRWIDPMGGQRPRLLVGVENGLGGLTSLEYDTSVTDYLVDLAEASSCQGENCERFTWSSSRGTCDEKVQAAGGGCVMRSAGSPVVSTVVRAVSTSDQLPINGRPFVKRTEYAYHDAYYEGIEQEFRGFGAADAIEVGDDTHPTSITRTHFYQGRRPNSLASDRTQDNPLEALKGRTYRTEVMNEQGVYLSSEHASFTLRRLLTGLNEVDVSYAFVNRTDTVLYDTASFVASPGAALSQTTPTITYEQAGAGLDEVASGGPDESRSLPLRSLNYAHIYSTVDAVDNVGNMLRQTAHGRSPGGSEGGADEAITSHSTPDLIGDDAAWLWRTVSTRVEGSDGVALGLTTNSYNSTGDLIRATQTVTIPDGVPDYEFDGDDNGAEALLQAAEPVIASTRYDAWGNATASCGGADLLDNESGCLRYGTVSYDLEHAMFPLTEQIATGRAGDGFATLTTTATWDRGLGVLLTARDPNNLLTSVTYDGLGRLTSMTPPAVAGCPDGVALTRISYTLGAPLSAIHSTTEQSCTGASDPLVSVSYVDGLGRARVSLTQAENSQWQRSGITTFTARGATLQAYQTGLISGSPSGAEALTFPGTPFTITNYDAFSRPVVTLDALMNPSQVVYHALSTDVWDANDLLTRENAEGEPDPTLFTGTPTTERKDGHGRVIDQVLRNRQAANEQIDYYRLWTKYRADGQVVRLTRGETATDAADAPAILGHVSARTFFYDSVGRRLGSIDPDVDNPAGVVGSNSWRYRYNSVGDLVAVRDPRGCGQNFYYDHAGRLIAEDYVSCGEAQAAEIGLAPLPAGAIGATGTSPAIEVDVRYYFDAYPTDPELSPSGITDFPGITPNLLGRATAVVDRGQRSLMAYDDRGNVIWSARQMAVIPNAAVVATSLTGDAPAVVDTNDQADDELGAQPDVTYDTQWYTRTAQFDHASRPRSMWLPIDPADAQAPRIGGTLSYNARNLPSSVTMMVGSTPMPIVSSLEYTRDGLVWRTTYGDAAGSRNPTVTETIYDANRRPTSSFTTRMPTAGAADLSLNNVSVVASQELEWDPVSNLTEVRDKRVWSEWPEGHKPQTYTMAHDALYRVTDVEMSYDSEAADNDVVQVSTCEAPETTWPPAPVSYPAYPTPTPIANIFESPLPQYQASTSPGPVLLDFTKGQFSRESQATRMDLDANDQMILEMVAPGVIRTERRAGDPEDAPPLYLFEGETENIARRTTEFDEWTINYGMTCDADLMPGPMRGSAAPGADRLNYPNTSSLAQAHLNTGGSLTTGFPAMTNTVFHYAGRFRFFQNSSPTRVTTEFVANDAWVRQEWTTPAVYYTGLARPLTGLPASATVWGIQIERSPFPTSYVHRPSEDTLNQAWRRADSLTFDTAPESMRDGVWALDAYPLYGTNDGAVAKSDPNLGVASRTFGLVSFGRASGSDLVAFHFDASGYSFVRVRRAGQTLDTPYTWSRHERVRFVVDVAADTLTVDGDSQTAVVIDIPGSDDFASGALRIGAEHDHGTGSWVVGTEAFARISEPRRVLNTDSMSSCPAGHTRGTNNGDHFGLPATDDVCWPDACATTSTFNQNCGTVASACGLCCTQDSDCGAGQECGINAGPRKGLPVGTNVCWDDECDTTRNPGLCGATTSACGLCPRLPDPTPILRFDQGTFSRGSVATRLDYDGEGELIVESVGHDVLRTERHISDSPNAPALYLFEGSRTNYVRSATSLEGVGWTKAGLRTDVDPDGVAADTVASPDPGRSRTAETVYLSTTGGSALQQLTPFGLDAEYSQGAVAASLTFSTFHRSGRSRIRITNAGVTRYSANYPVPSEHPIPSWWRFDYTIPASLSASNDTYVRYEPPDPYVISDLEVWGAQMEPGAFPTSFIPTTVIRVKREADKLEVPVAQVPNEMRTGRYAFDVYPQHGSSDGYQPTLKPLGLRGQTFGLISFANATSITPADGISLYYDDSGRSFVRVTQAAAHTDIRRAWERDQRVSIRVDLESAQQRIAVDGEWHNIANTDFPNTSMLVGGAYNDAGELDANKSAFARISEPRSWTTSCMTNVDCPSGHVCGTDNGAFFGGAATADVCWPMQCTTDRTSHCGAETAACGLCCVTDTQCGTGEHCGIDEGERKGLGKGSNACLPDDCNDQVLTAQQCGAPTAACGLCSTPSESLVAMDYEDGEFTRATAANALDFDPVTRELILRKYGANELRPERLPTDPGGAASLYLFEGERTNWVARSAMHPLGNVWGNGNTTTHFSSVRAPDGLPTAALVNTTPAPGTEASNTHISTAAMPVAPAIDPPTLHSYSIFYTGEHAWLWCRNNSGTHTAYVQGEPSTVWARLDTRTTHLGTGPTTNLFFGRKGGEPASTLKAWGGQVERAAFPSSFIYTDVTGSPLSTRAPDQLTFSSTPDAIRTGAWTVDVYPLHGSVQDGYSPTQTLGLSNQDFGLFAFAGGNSQSQNGNFISLHYGPTGQTSLKIVQSAPGATDIEIPFNWQRHEPIQLTVDATVGNGSVTINGDTTQVTWAIPDGPMMVGSLYTANGAQDPNTSAFARISEPRVHVVTTCEDDSACAQGTSCVAPVVTPIEYIDTASDWRAEMASVQSDDPMRTGSAPIVSDDASERVASLTYQYDWLANMTSWDDDAHQFYERSLGVIGNGADLNAGLRPSALYLATDLPTSNPGAPDTFVRGGYVELDYGAGGNVTGMTVHGQCRDAAPSTCYDTPALGLSARRAQLHAQCVCATEQHYQYRWDELNRMSEARRYDRAGSGNWSIAARQRYRYDGANQRVVKQTLDVNHIVGSELDGLDLSADIQNPNERIALYVYGGDYERRGLVRVGAYGTPEQYAANDATETQFVVGGARVVKKDPGAGFLESGGAALHPDDRVTVGITNLIGTTSAVIDLVSGALVETSTYYPNGARETYRAPDSRNVAAEPMGFTGKEADEEVGVVYFGERYLIPRIGRWASPDPLSIHAAGGGEALNAFHYVSGNLLQARDPLGLKPEYIDTPDGTMRFEANANGADMDFQFVDHPRVDAALSAVPDGAQNVVDGIAGSLVERASSRVPGGDEHPVNMLNDGAALVDAVGNFLMSALVLLDDAIKLASDPSDPDHVYDTVLGATEVFGPPIVAAAIGSRTSTGSKPKTFANQFPGHDVGPPIQAFSATQVSRPTFSRRLNYVVTESGELRLGRQRNEVGGGHIDLADGGPVQAAGEVHIVRGQVRSIDNSSGHYEPSGRDARMAAEHAFENAGLGGVGKYVEKVWNGEAWVPK